MVSPPHTQNLVDLPDPTPSSLRMAIIAPSRIEADLLRYCCTHNWRFEIVAAEHTGTSGLASVHDTQPALLLVSVELADMSYLDFMRRLSGLAMRTKIILLAHKCSEYLAHSLTHANYHGIICGSEEGLERLGAVIDRVRNGIRVSSPALEQHRAALRKDPCAFPKLLTDRHIEVLACISHLLSDEKIASHLHCSVNTVRKHRQHIMQKLDIHNAMSLASYGITKGFTAVPPPRLQIGNGAM